METVDRRLFLSASSMSIAALAIGAAPEKKPGKKKPLVIATVNGQTTVTKVMARLKAGADPLDAAIEGLSLIESDSKDPSVGYGGLPNIEGIVEVDAAVMHGPTHSGGAVAALKSIMHPAAVARAVMQRTPNCLIVGEGAYKFARECGFPRAELLTDEAREAWNLLREATDRQKNGQPVPAEMVQSLNAIVSKLSWYGSMHCLALDTHGDLAGVTTSPGLPFKKSGRVGDTPILGSGLYVDNDYGACVSTGTGELNLLNCSCHLVVENLRRGMNPNAACTDACSRVLTTTRRNPRFRDKDGQVTAGVVFYCITKDGRVGGASMGRTSRMFVHDGVAAKAVEIAAFPIGASKGHHA